MSTFTVQMEIGDVQGGRFTPVTALVDTGAAYSWVPKSVLEELGLEPSFQLRFVLADGSVIRRDLTETKIRLDGQVRTTNVVFGDETSDALLGAYSLEGFGMAVDPINRKLTPIPLFPMAMSQSVGRT